MTISVPPGLTLLEAVSQLMPHMEKFVSNRKSIEQDIVSFHALNETEAKNAQEAKAVIKQNESLVQEAMKISLKNEQDKKAIDSMREKFEEERRLEYQKIADAKLPANEALVRAQVLRNEVDALKEDVAVREKQLASDKHTHGESVEELEKDRKVLAEERKTLETQKQAIIDLDSSVKAKIEKLKQFNF